MLMVEGIEVLQLSSFFPSQLLHFRLENILRSALSNLCFSTGKRGLHLSVNIAKGTHFFVGMVPSHGVLWTAHSSGKGLALAGNMKAANLHERTSSISPRCQSSHTTAKMAKWCRLGQP